MSAVGKGLTTMEAIPSFGLARVRLVPFATPATIKRKCRRQRERGRETKSKLASNVDRCIQARQSERVPIEQ